MGSHRGVFLVSALLAFALLTVAVDRNNFKTCDQSSFCRRCRKVTPGDSVFSVVPNSVQTFKSHVTVELINRENQHSFIVKLESLRSNTFHLEIDEKSPLKPRYRVVDALKSPPIVQPIQEVIKGADETTVVSQNKKAVITHNPFRIDCYLDDVLTVSVNAKGLMRFEHLRTKPEIQAHLNDVQNEEGEGAEKPVENVKSIEDDDPGSWEENFKSHHDSKPNGPEAIALDFSFPRADILFGIPEHADSFVLKSTLGGDPYRLYNLDVFEYELRNGMALYGSVPVIYGHGSNGGTAGVYWQNPSETWVDIYDAASAKENVMSSIVKLVSGSSKSTDPLSAHFMSESGIVDAFILLGPTPKDAFQQYTLLTGTAPLPQMFAIAYHQCRWNYNDEVDMATVHNHFDEYDMPVDTFWLDIEYTDSKKYFTWDHHKFPHPLEMIKNLTDRGRHLTIIIDPHIKRDSSYFFHNDCTDLGYYVKNKDGNDYEGWCWPGAASYADFFNPEVRKYYADQYLIDNFKTTTEDVMLWNDMNEPSVFNGPEVTMLKDNLHFGGWEHRHVHNLYGHMHVMATHQGLLARSQNRQRPFILTRAHFAGTQRYAAIWTGDNFAGWDHMVESIPMCLSEAVAGFSFCGADVGGFFGNPEAELMERWYQLGSFLPFFRAHSHIDTKRREPWLFPEATRLVIRAALRTRYTFLPFWYTQFYEHEQFGAPIMRPMLSQYPLDRETFGLDTQFMIGETLLVRPVLDKGASSVEVYLPAVDANGKEGDLWYDVDDYRKLSHVGWEKIQVNSYKVPVFQRGGTIVPRKMRIRRATPQMINDPITLIVCVDKQEKARGTLYLDDEKSFEYRNGKYVYEEIEFNGHELSSKKIDPNADYPTKVWLERVIIAGLTRVPKSATLIVNKQVVGDLEVEAHGGHVTVRKPGINIAENWRITLNF